MQIFNQNLKYWNCEKNVMEVWGLIIKEYLHGIVLWD